MTARLVPLLLLGVCAGCLALSVGVARRPAREAAPSLEQQRSALARNPYLTEARLDLAFAEEMAGRFDRAETLYLEAYRHDRMYLTRWTLANFYFRRGREDEFWTWAARAAQTGSGDLAPLYDLCRRVDPEGTRTASRAVPARPEAERAWIQAAGQSDRPAVAAQVVARLAARGDPRDRGLLLGYVDQLLARGLTEDAVAAWNGLPFAGSKIRPGQGESLVNGELAPTLGAGFDWRVVWNPEALVTGHRIEFTGRVNDWELLWQPVVLEAGRRYTLRTEYTLESARDARGLHWKLGGAASPSLSRGGAGEWTFVAPRAAPSRLSLVYAREPGTPRLEGSVRIDRVSLKLEP